MTLKERENLERHYETLQIFLEMMLKSYEKEGKSDFEKQKLTNKILDEMLRIREILNDNLK